MRTENQIELTDKLTSWTQHWGLSFAFAVTQSVERSEEIISESIAVLLTPDSSNEFYESSLSSGAVLFARSVWRLASADAFRGFGGDVFFKMPVLTRAIVVLKIKARFSRQQISAVLDISAERIEDQLENARLLFSEGKNWIPESPQLPNRNQKSIPVDPKNTSALLNYGCTSWNTPQSVKKMQDLFSRYLGNDLETDPKRDLHEHLLKCLNCRGQFAKFKTQYMNWSTSIPVVEVDEDMKKQMLSVSKASLKLRRSDGTIRPPSIWVGVQSMWNTPKARAQLQAMAVALLCVVFLLVIRNK